MTEDWRTMMERAAARRASGIDLTAEQKERLEWVTKRNEAISKGVRAVDGVTFGKQQKGKS